MAMKKTQLTTLMEHLRARGSISGLEARSIHRIDSLARRINDLEAKGHKFRRERRKDLTGKRYVRYFYEGANANHVA